VQRSLKQQTSNHQASDHKLINDISAGTLQVWADATNPQL